jgi:hypothetical protein
MRAPSGNRAGSANDSLTAAARPVALDGCVQPGSAQLVTVGGGNQAAVLGTGPVGVVLSNQSDQNLCGWLPFAKTLAARGFRALVYNYGLTADPAGDVAKAAAKLRELGVRTVLLAGGTDRAGPGRAAVCRQAEGAGPVRRRQGRPVWRGRCDPAALQGGHQGVVAAPRGPAW